MPNIGPQSRAREYPCGVTGGREFQLPDDCTFFQVATNSNAQISVSMQIRGGIETDLLVGFTKTNGISDLILNPGANVIMRIRDGDSTATAVVIVSNMGAKPFDA